MKYSIKPKNDSDKENARQLELIMNHKFATYDDISEVIKEQIDSLKFKRPFIVNGHEELIPEAKSEIISFDQIVNDEIFKQILESGLHKSIKSLMEFGIAAEHISYDDIRGICIQSINPMDMCTVIDEINCNDIVADNMELLDDIELSKIIEPSFSINRNPFYLRSYASKDTMELVDAILFQKQKQPKENHPHGWYRKFDKKSRY